MKRFLIAALLLCGSASARAADTVTSGTFTRETIEVHSGIVIETWDVVSDASGNVTVTAEGIRGMIVRVTVDPDGGGTQPSDNFDGTLTDDLGVDVWGIAGTGGGSNMSNSTSTNFCPASGTIISNGTDDDQTVFHPMVTYGDLDLALTNMGDSKGATIRIFIKPEF